MSGALEGPIPSSKFSKPQDGRRVFGGPGVRHQRWPGRQENLVATERFIVGGLADPLPQLLSFLLDRFHDDDGVDAELGEHQGHHPLAALNAGIRDPAAFAGRDFDEADPLEVPDPATKAALRPGRRAEHRSECTLDLSVGIAFNLLMCRTSHRANMSHPARIASALLR